MSQLISTIWNYPAYNRLLAEPQLLTSTGESLQVKLVSLKPWTGGSQKGFNRHSFVAVLEGMGYQGVGAGASNLFGEAIQKAISEAYERLIYHALRGTHNFKTSNGFAAHPNRKHAVFNAAGEALERDAVLVHWLTKTPFLEISTHHELFQGAMIETSLAGTPFRAKHLLFSTSGWTSTLTLVAEERWGGGAIVAHGSGHNLKHALKRTLIELERQAAVAKELLPHNPGFSLKMPHLLERYTFSRERLVKASWIAGEKISWEMAAKLWRPVAKSHIDQMQVQELATGSVFVMRAAGAHLQDLYFGETAIAQINPARVETVEINLEPHFVA